VSDHSEPVTATNGMVAPSGEQFEIAFEDQHAVVVEVGGGIRTYDVEGRAVLDGYALDTQCTGARGTPLVPWPNRLADGRYRFDDVDYQVALTEPAKHNAIHGFLRWRSWTAREHSASRVVMGTVLHPLMGYPFTLDVAVAYTLAAGGLTVHTTATNVGTAPCPYGAGQHPYLAAGTDLVDECVLQVEAERWLPTDERGLPTGTRDVDGSGYDFRSARPVGDQQIDYAFTGLARDNDGLAWVRWTAPGGRQSLLWLDESYPFVEIYTGDTLPPAQRRRGLGVEPMTCAPDAFSSGDGLIRLAPGESVSTSWGVLPG